MSYHIPLRRKAFRDSSSHSPASALQTTYRTGDQPGERRFDDQAQTPPSPDNRLPGHDFNQIRIHTDYNTIDSVPSSDAASLTFSTPYSISAQVTSLARFPATLIGTSSVAPMVQRRPRRRRHVAPMAQRKPPAGTAQTIANGHAYHKHVQEQREFPEIKSVGDFATLIDTIINSPAEHKVLSGGRQAFWDGKDTVVIYNPRVRDKGTCFRPTAGKTYFDNLA